VVEEMSQSERQRKAELAENTYPPTLKLPIITSPKHSGRPEGTAVRWRDTGGKGCRNCFFAAQGAEAPAATVLPSVWASCSGCRGEEGAASAAVWCWVCALAGAASALADVGTTEPIPFELLCFVPD
jgi:hypothetical protein